MQNNWDLQILTKNESYEDTINLSKSKTVISQYKCIAITGPVDSMETKRVHTMIYTIH